MLCSVSIVTFVTSIVVVEVEKESSIFSSRGADVPKISDRPNYI